VIHLHEKRYEYLEEINEGILRQFPVNNAAEKPSVLDAGCGSGALSEAIRKKGYSVWGIEAVAPVAEKAKARITNVIISDLTDLAAVTRAIGQQKFDYIVFSDVLEHLYDPFTILKGYLLFLKPGGQVMVSVPNVAVWTNRIKLLFGVFNYADTGVMDRTHVRFFTFKSAKQLVAATGCSIVKVDYTPYFVRALLPLVKRIFAKGASPEGIDRRQLIDSPLYRLYMNAVYPIEYFVGHLWRPLFAFRIIIVGKR
jgi:2-polyprenyl-3-methyl-5-hydroxy-6-metoxy-1,4-benzoquinol methylase